MKVKSLLLSMCAIAALASCSQNDDEIPGGESNAPEAKVIIKLTGTGERASSRASGIPNDLDAQNGTVNNLTVFIFNKDGVVITKKYIGTPASVNANSVSTTTDATEVAVIANTGDLTGAGQLFATVSTKTALKAVLTDILKTPDTPAGGITQKDANLYMSGIGNLDPFVKKDETMQASVTIQLHFLAARIQLTKITFNGGSVKDNKYVQNNDFATTDDANFTITRVYLMSVQRMTQFLPTTDAGADYIAQNQKKYTGGVAWTAPWAAPAPTDFKQYDEYNIEAAADKFVEGTAAAKNSISDIGHWYTFTNDGVSDIANHPTVLVVEVKWRKTMATTKPKADAVNDTKYFATYFGGGDKDELKASQTYSVVLNLKGNFKPENQGGSGGGGTTDPTKPTVNSSVNVTVTAAKWANPINIEKSWL